VINGPGKSIQLIDGSNKLFFTSLVEIYKAVMVLLISFFFPFFHVYREGREKA
jgi:hypothetical protein